MGEIITHLFIPPHTIAVSLYCLGLSLYCGGCPALTWNVMYYVDLLINNTHKNTKRKTPQHKVLDKYGNMYYNIGETRYTV